MKSDSKKALYESIMTSVASEVKKVLNEGFYPNSPEYPFKTDDIFAECGQLGFRIVKCLEENADPADYKEFINILRGSNYGGLGHQEHVNADLKYYLIRGIINGAGYA